MVDREWEIIKYNSVACNSLFNESGMIICQ